LEDAKNKKQKSSDTPPSTTKQKYDFSSQYLHASNAKMDFEKARLEYQKSADSTRITLEREKMEIDRECKEKAMEIDRDCKEKAMEIDRDCKEKAMESKAKEVKVLFVQNMLTLGKTAQEIKDALELAGL